MEIIFAKNFAMRPTLSQSPEVTKPLAIVFYEKLLPGQQLVNRLQDLGYRVQAVTKAAELSEQVGQHKPMLLVAEFPGGTPLVGEAITALRQDTGTAHVAVLVYTAGANPELQKAARAAGANLTVSEPGILDQLPELLDQVLRID